MKKTVFLFCMCFSAQIHFGQTKLKPGFDPHEYVQLLSLTFFKSGEPDSNKRKTEKGTHTFLYQSPESELFNQWKLYLRTDHIAVIDIRGTVQKTPSWLENFYSAPVPATGVLQIKKDSIFQYQLAKNPEAYVHAGWLIGLAAIGPSVLEKMNMLYDQKGVHEFLMIGHSQGGALLYLLRSYLHYQQEQGRLPKDLKLKTYCSAAPKPGNLYYAYDFEHITQGGWSHTVVNPVDWVPETPISIQTNSDFNPISPVTFVKSVIKRQPLLIRIAGKWIVRKLDRSTRKSYKTFKKYFGKRMFRQIQKSLPELKQPQYSKGMNYMRTGLPIVLMPDDKYYQQFPLKSANLFQHHSFESYYYLLQLNFPELEP